MRLLWFSWKDIRHPNAGGAERVTDTILSRLVRDGHTVCLITSRYDNAAKEDEINGYRVIRVGNRVTVYMKAFFTYRKNFRGWADMVIDEMNTIPFFCLWYAKEPACMFVHQLCRRVWFYQIFLPLGLVGYFLEYLYLRGLHRSHVITVSESTKKDLLHFGFFKENISIIPESVGMEPLPHAPEHEIPKTIISLSSLRPTKRVHHVIDAFEIAKKRVPELRMIVIGKPNGRYGKKLVKKMRSSAYAPDLDYHDYVDEETKKELLKKADILCAAAVKEGWGLTVTEANTQGVPAIVYDVDGLRESVQDGQTGVVVKPTRQAMADAIIRLVNAPKLYNTFSQNSWEWSKTFTREKTYKAFLQQITTFVHHE